MTPPTEAAVDAQTAKVTDNPIATWHTEHVYFKRLLDLLDEQVSVFETGMQPSYELMLDVITYLREYSDRFHHPREDVAFERLARHRPELALVLQRLRQEHRVIATAGENLARLLDAIVEGSIVERKEVEAAAATYLLYYGAHIAREESDVLAHAGRCLTDEDWEAVRAAVPPVANPMFVDVPGHHYHELRRRLAAAR